jgi:hypothetical protein
MRLETYVGIDQPVITIERAEDLYPALDYIQTKMIELAENGDKKADQCANFIQKLMKQSEEAGFGSWDDIDNIQY